MLLAFDMGLFIYKGNRISLFLFLLKEMIQLLASQLYINLFTAI